MTSIGAAGVSQDTVALLVRDSPRVRPETKVAVRAVMERMGHHSHPVAPALRSRTNPCPPEYVVRAGDLRDGHAGGGAPPGARPPSPRAGAGVHAP